MNNSPLKKQILFLIITAIISVVGIVVLVRFVKMTQVKKDRVTEAKIQLTSYDQNKKIFADEAGALADIAERVTALERDIITGPTTPEFLSSLEALAKRDNVDFAITSVQTPGKDSNQKLLIDFSATGGQQNIDTFFKDISHQTYQLRFTRFSFFVDESATPVPSSSLIKTPVQTIPIWNALASIQIISF